MITSQKPLWLKTGAAAKDWSDVAKKEQVEVSNLI
jgi:hypothetical protein